MDSLRSRPADSIRPRPTVLGLKVLVLALFGLAFLGLSARPALAQAAPVDPRLPSRSRQFDFWVGEWSVNLRILQPDLTWLDARAAEAHIFPILNGKAVLELWDEEQIKGFSLRYFDPARAKWVLWLNWPNANSSGAGSLEGEFRHGRGEFYSRGQTPDGQTRVTRYSFSDITPNSLRWDDAFSNDGGRTWTHQWIMEFSRMADRPSLPQGGGPAHTYQAGNRCPDPAFRSFDGLAGSWAGEFDEGAARLTGYQVLDGCGTIVMIGSDELGSEAWFGHLTYNTRLSRLELLELDADPEAPASVYFGAEGSTDLVFYEPGLPALARVTVQSDADGHQLIWETRASGEAAWVVERTGRFSG